MKGLYVYGALLVALTFAVGALQHNSLLMAVAVIACACSAFSEVMTELVLVAKVRWLLKPGACLAIISWLVTGYGAALAVNSLIGA